MWPALVALASVVLAGCQPASGSGASVGASSSSAGAVAVQPSPSPESAELAFAPSPGSSKVRPDAPVTVGITRGELSRVTVASADGKQLKGELDAAGGWRLTDPLVAGTTYTVTAAGTRDDGSAVRGTSSFSTLKASRLVSTTLIPGDDWNVGVGMPVIVVFSAAVKNKQAAEAALQVSSTPAVVGAWRWFSSTEVHWRPKTYWPSGTKVNVTAAMSKVELANGVWGKRTTTSRFTVGRSQVMTVDTAKHRLTVRRNGSVVRTIPVTTGKAGFRTRNGIKVVMSRESKVRMDASTLGTDKNDPEYYNLLVNWALRLTYSGEFLHAAPWSVGSQGRANVSHGCTGMSTSNARWLYDNSLVGDVVVFTGSSRALEWGNGYTEWNKSFEDYASGA
jgi:lipoprotein-anchoring transpeptidase ErfK/SrfK/predicted small secreted protein